MAPLMSIRENRDVNNILAKLREQVNNYVPGETEIIILEQYDNLGKYFYDEVESHQIITPKQELETLVSEKILGRNSHNPISKYNCYHIFCKSITLYRNNKYPTIVLPSSMLRIIWKEIIAEGYKNKFQEAAKLFNSGKRNIYPEIDYSIYFHKFKLIE